MGGLISFYAVLKYPKVFGGAGVFSPSVWICKEDLLNLVKTTGKKVNSKIYFYCGKLEGTGMVPDMLKTFEELAAVSKSKMMNKMACTPVKRVAVQQQIAGLQKFEQHRRDG